MIKDYFKIATGGFIHRKKRTWLTLLGIIIGIASVVSLLSLGFGMYDSLNNYYPWRISFWVGRWRGQNTNRRRSK